MNEFILHLLKKTASILKKEPMIFLPCLTFYCTLLIIQSFTTIPTIDTGLPILELKSFILLIIILLLGTCVEPMTLIGTLLAIQKNNMPSIERFNRLKPPFLLIILLSVIESLIVALSLYGFVLKKNVLMLEENRMFFMLIIGMVGIIFVSFKLGTFFMQHYLVTTRQKVSILNIHHYFKQSFAIFYQKKWVTLWVCISGYVIFGLMQTLVVQMASLVIPKHGMTVFEMIVISITHTIKIVFIFRFFLYLKPALNLSDS